MPTPQCITTSVPPHPEAASKPLLRARIPPAVPRQPACSRATPRSGHRQVHRHAVRYGDGQQDSGRGADPSIDPWIWIQPSARSDCRDLDPVHLIAQHDGAEPRHRPAEGEPPVHDIADRRSLQSPRSNPRPGSFPRPVIPATTPYRSRHPGISNRGIGPGTGPRNIADVPAMSDQVRPAPLPRFPASRLLPIHPLDLGAQCTEPLIDAFVARARSARRCGSCCDLRPPVPRAAWPSRPGCRATRPSRL